VILKADLYLSEYKKMTHWSKDKVCACVRACIYNCLNGSNMGQVVSSSNFKIMFYYKFNSFILHNIFEI
jgi:hypothetical protein